MSIVVFSHCSLGQHLWATDQRPVQAGPGAGSPGAGGHRPPGAQHAHQGSRCQHTEHCHRHTQHCHQQTEQCHQHTEQCHQHTVLIIAINMLVSTIWLVVSCVGPTAKSPWVFIWVKSSKHQVPYLCNLCSNCKKLGPGKKSTILIFMPVDPVKTWILLCCSLNIILGILTLFTVFLTH